MWMWPETARLPRRTPFRPSEFVRPRRFPRCYVTLMDGNQKFGIHSPVEGKVGSWNPINYLREVGSWNPHYIIIYKVLYSTIPGGYFWPEFWLPSTVSLGRSLGRNFRKKTHPLTRNYLHWWLMMLMFRCFFKGGNDWNIEIQLRFATGFDA